MLLRAQLGKKGPAREMDVKAERKGGSRPKRKEGFERKKRPGAEGGEKFL